MRKTHKIVSVNHYFEVKNMVNYKEMYSILFKKMTDIIEEIQQIQRQTEEMYLDSKRQ